jgi:hypothetical protein
MNSFRGFLFYAALPAMAFWSTEVLGFTDFGHGRPVTAPDLSGKKFCWSNGIRTFYGANGKLSNSLGVHDRPWSVPQPGVLKTGQREVQTEVLSDGRLHGYRYCLICGDHDLDSRATPCN